MGEVQVGGGESENPQLVLISHFHLEIQLYNPRNKELAGSH